MISSPDLIQESFQRLFPYKTFTYFTELEYNRRLSPFNANIKFYQNKISINLNLEWKTIDDEIKIGLMQTLLLKVFKKKYQTIHQNKQNKKQFNQNTPNIKLYHHFVKNIPILTPKTKIDPQLEDAFLRVNRQFFSNKMEKPNLTWGTDSRRKLASYNFHQDTVTISTIFQTSDQIVLDYLMYHELLHKQHQFKHKNGRSFYHTPQFKFDERQFPNQKEIETKINHIIRNSKRNNRKKPTTKYTPNKKVNNFLKNLKLDNFF